MATDEQKAKLRSLLEPIMKECGIESFKVGYINVNLYYEIFLDTNKHDSQFHPAEFKPKVYFNKRQKERSKEIHNLLLEGEITFPKETDSIAQVDNKEEISFDEYLKRLEDPELKHDLVKKLKECIPDALCATGSG